jgi:hypothetical protein
VKRVKNPFQHAAFSALSDSEIDGMPGDEDFRDSRPRAVVFAGKEMWSISSAQKTAGGRTSWNGAYTNLSCEVARTLFYISILQVLHLEKEALPAKRWKVPHSNCPNERG